MASELEPEVPAIDQSLLECSAEETAGVSAGPGGTSGPRRPSPVGGPTPGNPGAARLSGLPARGVAPSLTSLFSHSPEGCSVHRPPLTFPSCPEPTALHHPSLPQLPLSPQHKAFDLYARSCESEGKRLLGVWGVIALLSLPGSVS